MPTRSLGTLTLDLIAKVGSFEGGLSKADRLAKRHFKNIEQNVNKVAKAFVAYGAAAVGGMAAATIETINNAREIKNLSAVANTTTKDFQRITYAAQRYGVEQDKVADILKDTTDKVGDFLQTGGGPLADFFENIAPRVGVTAQQFRTLSGPQALQLYIDSLEKANVSQNEMTFFLEAIASDATLLLPLLRNNASELDRLGDEAEDFGAVIDDIELRRLEEARKSIDLLTARFAGLKNEVVIESLPAINDLIDLLSDKETVAAAETLANAVVVVFTKATEAIRGTVEITQFLAEEFAAATAGIQADDVSRLERDAKKIRDILNGGFLDQVERVRFFGPDGVVEFLNDDELKQKLADIEQAIDTYYDNAAKRPKIPVVIDPAADEVVNNNNNKPLGLLPPTEIEKTISALQMQVELLGKSNTEIELAKLKAEGATEAQLALARAALETVDVYESEVEAAKALKEYTDQINDQAEAIRQQLMTEEEAIKESYERRREIILQATELTETERQDILTRLQTEKQEELDEAIKNSTKGRNATIAESYSTLLDIVGEYYDGMQGEQAAYARVAIALGQALLDADKRKALQEIVANTQAAAMKAYDALAGIPYVGPVLGAAAAGTVLLAGGAAAAKVTGLAHDGIDSIPEDGTWLLEKGERVTTEKTSAKLDSTLEDIRRNQGDGMGMGDIRIVNAWNDDVIENWATGPRGERTIMNVVERNQQTIQSLAGGGP